MLLLACLEDSGGSSVADDGNIVEIAQVSEDDPCLNAQQNELRRRVRGWLGKERAIRRVTTQRAVPTERK